MVVFCSLVLISYVPVTCLAQSTSDATTFCQRIPQMGVLRSSFYPLLIGIMLTTHAYAMILVIDSACSRPHPAHRHHGSCSSKFDHKNPGSFLPRGYCPPKMRPHTSNSTSVALSSLSPFDAANPANSSNFKQATTTPCALLAPKPGSTRTVATQRSAGMKQYGVVRL